MADTAKFCPRCGTQVGAAAPAGTAYAAPQPLEYTIQGSNLQVARVQLKPGQEVYAEAGKMVYKTNGVSWETRMTGESIGEKILGALRRKFSGESLFLTYFKAGPGGGEVGFAGNYPGKIQALELAAGQSVLAQRDAFLLAQPPIVLKIAFVKKLGAGFFGGEGFILEQFDGPGTLFIHAGGDFIEFKLEQGQQLQIDTGCIVCFDSTVDYDIQFAGGIKTALFGGEGLFLATLTGPGKVIVQSMTLNRLRQALAPGASGGDEKSPLNALSGIFSTDD